MDQKLLKLNTLLKAIKKDVVTPQDIMGFISVFLDEVKKTKDSLEVLTEEKLAYLDSVLKQFEEKRADLLEGIDSSIKEREKYLTDEFGNSIDALTSSVSSEITPLRDVLTESIKEAKSIIKQLKNVKIKDGVDGKDADEALIVEKVLEKIVLPEYKDVALDSGEQIVDKINALDLSDDNKIDASHIKNLPEPKMIGGGSTARNLYQLGDVSLSNPTNDQVLKYNSTTGLWENGTGGGGGTPATTVVSETAFGQSSAVGTSSNFAREDHTHGTPVDPIPAHVALADPHTQYQKESEKDVALGYAGLDGTGKINPSQLPAIAVTNTFVVGSQAAMLALTAETGDVAVRTDLNKSFILAGSNPTVLGDWQELLTPTDLVTSFNGRTGAITPQAGDYDASQITNFASTVLATVLTGLSLASNAIISASDTVLSALGKLQAQVTERVKKVGDTMTGALEIIGSSNAKQLRIKGHSTQTEPLLQLEKNTSTSPVCSVLADGTFEVRNRVTGNDGAIRLVTGVNPIIELRGDPVNGYYAGIDGYMAGVKTFNVNAYGGFLVQPTAGYSAGTLSYYQNATGWYVRSGYLGVHTVPLFEVRNYQGANNPWKLFQDGSIVAVGASNSLYKGIKKRTGLTATASGSGSGLSAGTYYYKVCTSNFVTETISDEVSITITAGQNVNLSWNYADMDGVDHYRVYRATSAGGYTATSRIDNGTTGVPYYTTTFQDTGITPIAGTPPTAITFDQFTFQVWENQTGAILNFKDSAGNSIAKVRSDGGITVGNTVRLKGYTVATLPTGVQGDCAFVTDALVPAWGANVVGGGAVVIKVFYNGTNWIVD